MVSPVPAECRPAEVGSTLASHAGCERRINHPVTLNKCLAGRAAEPKYMRLQASIQRPFPAQHPPASSVVWPAQPKRCRRGYTESDPSRSSAIVTTMDNA